MTPNTDPSVDLDGAAAPQEPAGSEPKDTSAIFRRIPRVGIWAWSFVGLVVVAVIVVIGLAAVSEIVLPMTFAAVLAVMFKPLVGVLNRHRFKPTLAAGLVVLGLLALMTGVVVATVRGVADQVEEISANADAAIDEAADQTEELSIDKAALERAREAVEDAEPLITGGVLSGLVSGFSVIVEVASGVILGSLIMYYLLKDGRRLRGNVVAAASPSFQAELDDFIGDACRILRDYGKGRTVMSAIVSAVVGLGALLLGMPLVFTIVVVNFIGGYIPYIGAFLGGGLAVVVALGDGGIGEAAIMLAIVLVSNLALENVVEPKVMGKSLDVHPLVVLVVTALGGLLGGIVGLILAVPGYVIARTALSRLRKRGVVERAAKLAQPAVQHLLD